MCTIPIYLLTYMDEKIQQTLLIITEEDEDSSIDHIHLGGNGEGGLHLWYVKSVCFGANTAIMEHVLKHIYSLLLEHL